MLLYFFRLYNKYLGPKSWLLLIFTVLVAVSDALGISMIMPLLKSVNMAQGEEGDEEGGGQFLFEITDFFGVTGEIGGILVLIVSIFVFKAGFKVLNSYYSARFTKRLFTMLKVDFFDRLMRVNFLYFAKKNTGHFIAIMTGHTQKLVTSYISFLQFISNTIMTIAYMTVASLISPTVAGTTVIFGALIVLMFRWPNKYVKKISKKQSTEQKGMAQLTVQVIHAFKYLVTTSTIGKVREPFVNATSIITGLNFKNQMVNGVMAASKELVAILVLMFIVVLEVYILENDLSSVLAVLFLFYRSINQLIGVQTSWMRIVGAVGFIESADEEFTRLAKEVVGNGTKKLEEPLNKVVIEADQLKFGYNKTDEPILRDLSFTIQPNTTIGVVGQSGSGKTTLVDIITGLLPDYEGRLNVNGVDLKEYDRHDICRRIGYVSQDLTVFDDSVMNNITMFEKNPDIERVKDAAKQAFADEFISELKDGYNTTIGDKGMRLSGGQKQRLFIARELYKNPELLVLDEATSALDANSESYIKASVDALRGKLTVIIIAHRLSTIKDVDEIFVLNKGTILEHGSFDQLISKNSHFNELVESQMV